MYGQAENGCRLALRSEQVRTHRSIVQSLVQIKQVLVSTAMYIKTNLYFYLN